MALPGTMRGNIKKQYANQWNTVLGNKQTGLACTVYAACITKQLQGRGSSMVAKSMQLAQNHDSIAFME